MFFYAVGVVPVRPIHYYVLRMALVQPYPFLVVNTT